MAVTAAPPFLVGTMGPGISADLGLSVSALAATISLGYLVAAVLSPAGGLVVQRIAPPRALRLAGLLTSIGVALVAVATSPLELTAAFVSIGLANAIIQPASNGTLATAVRGQLQGALFGVVQSAIPAATLLAGILLALLHDVRPWREAMVVLFLLTLVPQLVITRSRSISRTCAAPTEPLSDTGPGRTMLVAFCTGGFLGSAAATTVAVFGVAGGLAGGLSPAVAAAGLMLGSGCCVLGRVWTSWRWGGHAPRRLLFDIAGLQLGGVVGLALLTTGTTVGYIVGLAIAFGSGWGWTGLLNLAIARTWTDRVATVTGVMQLGLFGGGVAGPLLYGAVADADGYTTAWFVAAAGLLGAAIATTLAARLLGQTPISDGADARLSRPDA
ncbi:putative MFS family arabinose efflux permease [Mycobacterium frederiksbergense]|uniref:MFS family arabinose efflux permease n=1 Tax=Mycolicibacterium frederiksbergense TaxID=117567 RepID=A0ABT6L6Z3_9MYCO|nr:MFS transporter [Mycolicibacterium frederiksbergense]MDH6198115.1 putative MFS family arabinose efflux permease [Mycolicibacterium frederiksbergense]